MSTENLNSEPKDDKVIEDAAAWQDLAKENVVESEPEVLEPVIVDRTVSEDKEAVIVADEPVETKPSIQNIDNGIIGTGNTEVKPKPKKAETKDNSEKIALLSEKNVFWEGVGRVGKGYNIVDAEEGKKWLTRNFIRLATPEEIKQEFGK